MDTTPAFGFNEACSVIVGDMAQALSVRKGEAPERQFARSQAATYMIMALLPRDVIETILASRCVMFHELMVAGVRGILCPDTDQMRRGAQSGLLALDKGFCRNLDDLRRYQQRPAQGSRDAPNASPEANASPEPNASPETVRSRQIPPEAAEDAPTEAAQAPAFPSPTPLVPAPSVPAGKHAVQPTPLGPGLTDAVAPSLDDSANLYRPTADAVAACRANPEAMTALEAGDPIGFARALGIDQPSEEFLAAARAPGSPFDPAATGPWPDSVLGRRET